MNEENILPIDLGTTFSESACLSKTGIITVTPDMDGNFKTPSVVSYAGVKPVVGKAALPDLVLNPKFVIRCGKRYMGKMTHDGKPIPLIQDPAGNAVTAVDFSAAILRYLKEGAEIHLGTTINKAVITVPAYFMATERQNTKAAAMIAGFTEVKLQDEPVAAAMHYGLEKGRDELIVVVDFGGGTLDCTAIDIRGSNLKVLATTGDSELGGSNYNECICQYVCSEANTKGINISVEKDLADFNQCVDRCTEGKEMLARKEKVIIIAESKGKRHTVELDRKTFRDICSELDKRFEDCCRRLLEQLTSMGKRVDRVILVGGSSRLAQVPEIVKDVFGIEASKDTDPDFVVVKGAAIEAVTKFGEPDQEIVLGSSQRFLASEITMQTVAAHAICVAARRGTDIRDKQEYNCVIVPANTPLPYEFEERFAPVDPRQTSVVAKIVQGEPDAVSKDSAILRKITVPIKASDKHADRIILKGKYTEEGLLETVFIDELLNRPVSDSFVYSAGLTNTEINQKRNQLASERKG